MPLTDHQELAAESRGGARLVSAAAGSGKTKVLVERLMRYVDRGADIDQFLVITYTRAAAAELRSRILSALGERIAADPMNRRLRRQTELCCRASIGTSGHAPSAAPPLPPPAPPPLLPPRIPLLDLSPNPLIVSVSVCCVSV